ncbi:hypothetical protein FDENT_12804 [Fusarium denticulatum]|uniref:Uncharacterized protein n=1 Tax=Fusarium denticulatum TaxID=48507 RepID=A0A8H5WNL4_9HYPO|nr:hypothetical protein FDENT_12804 [Fusarium denticulatum]
MASPCLSRLLLIFLLGAIHVVAHPMSKDKPSESGNVVVQGSPSLEWKPKEENHKHNHVHHGSQEPAVTYEKIMVKLDDKGVSKHKSDADGDEESTETEYPSEDSSKHDETTGTTHNEKRVKISDGDCELTDEEKEIEEMEELASKYAFLNRQEKKRLKHLFERYKHIVKEEEEFKKSKPGRIKEPKYNLLNKARKQKDHEAQLDNLEKYKGYKPKDARPWWALTIDKHDEAIHHKNELAPTGERGLETKRKIWKRCDPIPWWVKLIIKEVNNKKAKKKEKKKAKEEEERRKKEEEERREKDVFWPRLDDHLNKAISQKEKDSLDSKQKTTEEKEETLPNVPLRDKPKPWYEDKTSKGFSKRPGEERETRKNKGSGLNDNKPNSSALQQKKDKDDKQKSEVRPNTASEHSKDGHLNQSKNSLTARMLPPHRVYEAAMKTRINKAWLDFLRGIGYRKGQEHRIKEIIVID